VLCLIYNRSFDGLVGIYDCNWYIKRLDNIETDYNWDRYFRPLGHNFRPGDLDSRTPLHKGLNRRSHWYPCLPCFKPLVTALILNELPVQSHESEPSFKCLMYPYWLVIIIYRIDFGTVPTVWYFLCVIFLLICFMFQNNSDFM
jgi:hypothetical protein